MNKDFYKKLGENIKQARENAGLTQQELADKINKSINFIGKIEIAFSKPSIDTLIDISKVLNVKISDLTHNL